MKKAASDQRGNIKFKATLLETIKSITSKELKGETATRFIQLQSELDDKLVIMATDTAEEWTIKAAYILSYCVDQKCPLQTWQSLVLLIATRQAGTTTLDLTLTLC